MSMYNKRVNMGTLVGKVVKSIHGLEKDSERVKITTECGQEYLFYHEQACCEDVSLNDFEGDKSDLVGGTIVTAVERTNMGDEDSSDKYDGYCESFTWTFYDIQTTKGSLWMRWLGESSGDYSEEVYLVWLNKPEEKL